MEQVVGANVVLTATAVNTDGDALEDIAVTFETAYNLGEGDFTSREVTTTQSGEASTTVSSTLSGNAIFTATAASDVVGTVGVTFVPGQPDDIELTVSESVLNPSMQATVVATVTDKHDNVVADGTVVTFSVDLSELGTVNPLTDATVDGVATTVFTAGSDEGTGNIRADAGDVFATVEVEVRHHRLYLPLVLRNYPPPWEFGTNSGNKTVYQITVCPNNDQVVFAGTNGQGVLKSTDGGASWASSGLSSRTVYAPAVAPGSGCDTVYAATYGEGVFKSTNGGSSWNAANSGLGSLYLNFMVADPAGNLYVGTGNDGVYRSTTGAASWSQRGLDNQTVFYLAIDPDDSTRIYAGLSSARVFKTENSGQSWTQVSSGLAGAGNIWGLSVAPNSGGQTVIAASNSMGVFVTDDGGADWDRMWPSGNEQTVFTVQALERSGDLLFYAGTDGQGVFRSSNGGTNWTGFNSGLVNLTANFLSSAGDYLYLGANGGAWRRQLVD
jgi:photosystem II stability/assembly factor-like uncharacterized protein